MRSRLLIAGLIAAMVAGYAWYRTLTFAGVTGPWTAAWYDADGALVDTRPIGVNVGDGWMNDAPVLGDRLIVSTSGPERDGQRTRGGFAWISPAAGQARIAYPVESKRRASIEGVAVRDTSTFALLLHLAREVGAETRDYLAVGIAGRDGWIRRR